MFEFVEVMKCDPCKIIFNLAVFKFEGFKLLLEP